jgi:hypothetical protein
LALILALGAFGTWLTRELWMPARAPEGPAIAVLPFVNLSGDPQQEYFSDGLTEDLMTELSRASRDLRVLARNTTSCALDREAQAVRQQKAASLGYASPESWGTLPTFDPPNEQSPTKPVLQVALN